MDEHWRSERLPELVRALAARPGHERLRVLLQELLREAFGAAFADVEHEFRLPEVRGRADMLFGATVIELESDLRRERADVESRLPDYLAERQRRTRRRYLGLATTGATFLAFELRDGRLVELARHETDPAAPEALLAWLEPALSDRDDLVPDALRVRRELGRESLTWARAEATLESLWQKPHDDPEVAVKRGLWDGLLREAYGAEVGDDPLFLQHTYLTIVAKTLAARVLDLPADDPEAILSGRALREAGILGAVESDFFDWLLLDSEGADLVARVARQVRRFRLHDLEIDVLKALYESLIDPAQRHDLGEYYTPDWLAARMVREVVKEPLAVRVLDPACGSGTFLFHAVRRLLEAAREAGLPAARAVREASLRVRGLDVHPVAVIIARVTWLLALGEAVREREGDLHVPVYLGDALQWNLAKLGEVEEVVVPVPGEGPLYVPAPVAADQELFERVLALLATVQERQDPVELVRAQLDRLPALGERDRAELARTYERLLSLARADRDRIWPFVLRNLVRPVWLSRPDQRAEIVIGNPPWIAYRHLSPTLKERMSEAGQAYGLWVGGVLATQQDVAALFWARAAERYLAPDGTIAFVLPWAALNGPAFAPLRRGEFGNFRVVVDAAWSLEELRELFPNSSCVLFGRRDAPPAPLPAKVLRFRGDLPRRDATESEVAAALRASLEPWPPIREMRGTSPYRERFKQGATIVPRRFFFVERERGGRLGTNPSAPLVRGRTGTLDKPPWNTVEPPRGPIEARFLRPVVLGESIAPFRLLDTPLAVIPVEDGRLLDSTAAAAAGHRFLGAWLRDCEAKWERHARKRPDGRPRMTLLQQLDHMRKLSNQRRGSAVRLVFTKAGTVLSAAPVRDLSLVVDHKAYVAASKSEQEAACLMIILSSSIVLERIAPMQTRGSMGRRDFDMLTWELPIPEFDPENGLHREIAALGAECERVASTVVLPEGSPPKKRRAIRGALADAGLAERADALVTRLLDGRGE
jgi:hypothetical protein